MQNTVGYNRGQNGYSNPRTNYQPNRYNQQQQRQQFSNMADMYASTLPPQYVMNNAGGDASIQPLLTHKFFQQNRPPTASQDAFQNGYTAVPQPGYPYYGQAQTVQQ